MSGDSSSSSRSNIRGLRGGEDHDRHIQAIIEHTSNLFPETEHTLPQISSSSNSERVRQGFTGRWGQIPDEAHYDGLDDFDRSLLGHSQTIHRPASSTECGQRLSLPLGANANGSSRVLGDASHHFRPFVPRDPDHRSQFQSTGMHDHGDRQKFNHASSAHETALYPDSSQALPYQLSTRNTLSLLKPLEESTLTRPIPSQSSKQRTGVLGRATRQSSPSTCNVEKSTPPIVSSLGSSSPSNAAYSSPSTRISLEKQRQVTKRDQLVPKWNQKLELDLDHASSLPPIVNNTRLIDPGQSLPDRFQAIFPFKLFNVVQSRCFPLVYGTNENVVISAPTGSGKTAILEMAICKLVSSQGDDNFKVVYQAPTKSLCSEKARDWQRKFSHMSLQCVELTGDTSQAEAHRIGNASIIVTTPEKWDSITRKWKDHRKLLDLVRLVLIDEIHILKDTRGATLEAVVSRMKTIGASIRFVAISATVPNIEDVAKWLGRDQKNQDEPARFEVFGEELRPVKLQRYVYGYEGAHNDFIFEKALDGKLNLLLAKHSEKKPIMVFCFTRKSCERTAQSLAEWWSTCRANDRAWPSPADRIPVLSQDLQELVRHGVAFHHAGLDLQDRAAIEASFLNGQLHVICCTSTLAVGVNLPCHTVVLKGTSHYTDDGPQEYSDLEIMQMLGRAGRPQFDKSAVAIIMTKVANTQRYEKLVSGEERLESTLHQNLLEHINSEIGLGTIQDIHTAKKWINGTFLSVRVRQSPHLYNLENIKSAAGADEQMEEWCERNVKLLQDHGLVTKRTPLICTEYGQAMSRYMIQFETMKLLLSMPRSAGLEEMLKTICKATEFKDFRFKPAERAVFRELNKSPLVLHPIKETLTLTWHKIFMTVQIHLGGVELPTDKETNFIRQNIMREKRIIFDRLRRLVRCVIDCKVFESDGLSTKAAIELARSIAAHAWENKPAQLSQIPGFGPVAVRKWTSQGIRTVLGVADKGIQDIERIASRNPPYGRNVQKILENFPRLTLKADIIESRAPSVDSDEQVSVTVRVHLGHRNAKAVPCWKDKVPALSFMALSSDGNLAYIWRGNMKKLDTPNGLDLKFPVALVGPKQTIFCHFSCEEIVGTQVMKTLEPNIPVSVFANIKRQELQPTAAKPDSMDFEADYECISDEAMLNALGSPSPMTQDSQQVCSGLTDNAKEDFPLIDELLQGEASSRYEPQRMDNGKYFCNHHCRNGGLTKSGKNCSHKCCHEGIDKYRPPKQFKNPGDASSMRQKEKTSKSRFEISETPIGLEAVEKENQIQLTSTKKPREIRVDNGEDDLDHLPQLPKVMRKRSNEIECPKDAAPKRIKSNRSDLPSSLLTDAEYVDLYNVSDDGGASSIIQTKNTSTNSRHREKMLLQHGGGKGNRSVSPNDEDSATTPGKLYTVCTLAKPNLLGDIDNNDEMSDLPDLDELFYCKKPCEQRDPSEAPSPQITGASDETLYPGESNLSFTTVDELQKAADRFDLPSASDTIKVPRPVDSSESPQEPSLTSPPVFDMIARTSTRTEDTSWNSHVSEGKHCAASGHLSTSEQRAEGAVEYCLLGVATEPSEPAWVADFDSELIESLRGVVNFVD
ncbi:P-loop containing nucleoside triphosphate hydrolase protein [Xylaria nigripes]|nr:P-loop containing nucleoside triphosphate hydrolase protein [Xylaria nigripes]